jgi:hypothetical protein
MEPLYGWSELMHIAGAMDGSDRLPGPKPTIYCVPAGSVYYFETKEPKKLIDALTWHGSQQKDISSITNRRSGLYGEMGYGIGVCSVYQ